MAKVAARPGATKKRARGKGQAADGRQADATHIDESQRHLVDKVAKEIQNRISSGEFPVGSWLRQERLAQDLGISRMPVREALRQLHILGTVEIIANRGARVRLPSLRDITEVYELRGILEGHAGALAAELMTEEQLDRLREAEAMFHQIVADLAKGSLADTTEARPRWQAANSQFHGVIIEASGNNHLAEIIDQLHGKIPRNLTWLAIGNDSRRLERNAVDHSKIIEAIESGDSDRARKLLIAHAKRASDLLARTFG